MRNTFFHSASLSITLCLSICSSETIADEIAVYFGTYTRGDSKGIYHSKLNLQSGALSEARLVGEMANPSFLAGHRSGKFLYAASEVGNLDHGGEIHAFRIEDDHTLVPLNRVPSYGKGPCHISLTSSGSSLFVANYGGGSVASYPILSDGKIGEAASKIQHEGRSVDLKRQKEPHAHSINPGAGDHYVYAADLGCDRVFIYKLDPSTSELQNAGSASVSAGSGPRHFAAHSNGKFAYVINELLRDVTAFSVSKRDGRLRQIQKISTLPDEAEPTGSTAEIRIHPSGKFLYGSNRGHDSIVVYQIDQKSGKLSWVENENIQGKIPRNFGISPDGKFLLAAGQTSNTVSVFSIDQETGALNYTEQQIEVPMPVCVLFAQPAAK